MTWGVKCQAKSRGLCKQDGNIVWLCVRKSANSGGQKTSVGNPDLSRHRGTGFRDQECTIIIFKMYDIV